MKVKTIVLKDKFPMWASVVAGVVGTILGSTVAYLLGASLIWIIAIMTISEILSAILGIRISWKLQEKFEEDNE